MLSRAQRLSSVEFNRVFEQGRVLRHPLLQVRALRREDENSSDDKLVVRAAFVAPKKIGKATVRNRVRRRVRERFRLLQSEYSGKLAGCDLVWIIGASAQQASTFELDAALNELCGRVARQLEKPQRGKLRA